MFIRYRLRGAPFVLLAVIAFVPSAASSHHDVDLSKTIPFTRTVTITQMSWDGAHVMYRVQMKDEAERVQSLQVLGASPKLLRARGIEKSTFSVGDEITLVGRLESTTSIVSPIYFISTDQQRYEMGFYPQQMRGAAK